MTLNGPSGVRAVFTPQVDVYAAFSAFGSACRRARAARRRRALAGKQARPTHALLRAPAAISPAGNSAMPAGSGYIQNGVGWVANFTQIYPNTSYLTPGCPSRAWRRAPAHRMACAAHAHVPTISPDPSPARAFFARSLFPRLLSLFAELATCCTASSSLTCCLQIYYVVVDVMFQALSTSSPRIYKAITYDVCNSQLVSVQVRRGAARRGAARRGATSCPSAAPLPPRRRSPRHPRRCPRRRIRC